MRFASISFLVTVTLLTPGTQPAAVSTSIQKCARSDPKFLDCFRISFENGIRIYARGDSSVGVSRFEPFTVSNLTIDLTAAGGAAKLVQKYDNMEVHGTSGSTVVKVDASFDDASPHMNLEIFSPTIHFISDYEIAGNFLVFPINANGKCNTTMYEVTAKHTAKLTKETRDGKKYLKIVDYAVDLIPKRIHFDYDNVYPDSPEVSDEIEKRINDNSLKLSEALKFGFAKPFVEY